MRSRGESVAFLHSIYLNLRQLDGNVHRLLSRVLALHAPPKAKATLDILWKPQMRW